MANKKTISKKEIEVKEESTYLGYDVKTIITVFLLVTVYPVGLVMMFVWMKWPNWLKALISLPAILAILWIVLFFVFVVNMVG